MTLLHANIAGGYRHVTIYAFIGWLGLMGSAVVHGAQYDARGEGIGEPPARADLSPAQRRLMARRAAELRALRDALGNAAGAPTPAEVGHGTIEIQGRITSSRLLEEQELPDGRWRAVVEVTVPHVSVTTFRERVEQVLTRYLEFRNGLLRSKQELLGIQASLNRDLAEADADAREAIEAALQGCQADLRVLDRALEDLEAKTLRDLEPPSTAPATEPSM